MSSPCLCVVEDNAVPTHRIVPRQCTFLIAHHVAAAAFKTKFVVKDDSAVGHGYEEICRTHNDALTRRACLTYRRVNSDMGGFMNTKFNSFHSVFEGNWDPTFRTVGQSWNHCHPKLLNPAHASLIKSRVRTPRRFRSSARIFRRPGFGNGLSTRNIRSTTLAMSCGYMC